MQGMTTIMAYIAIGIVAVPLAALIIYMIVCKIKELAKHKQEKNEFIKK